MDLFNKKQERYEMCSRYLNRLKKSDSLLELFTIHRQMWSSGLRHSNIGPCEYGMFRTEDITTMMPNEVYLGNVFGLSTLPLTEWIGTPEEPIITEQYRNHLISNVSFLQSLIYDNGLSRDSICKGIADASDGVLRPDDIRVLDKSLDMNRLHSFIFIVGNDRRISNFIIASGGPKADLMLLPEGWMEGKRVNTAFKIHQLPVWRDHRFPEFRFTVKRDGIAGKLKAYFTIEKQTSQSHEQKTKQQSTRQTSRGIRK